MPNPNHLTLYDSNFTEVDGQLTLKDEVFDGRKAEEILKVNFVFMESNSTLKAFCKSLEKFPSCTNFSFEIGYFFRNEGNRFKASDYKESFEEFATNLSNHPGLSININFCQNGPNGGTPENKKEYLAFVKEFQNLVVQHAKLSKISVSLDDVVKDVNKDEFTNILTGLVFPCESLAFPHSNLMRDILEMSKGNLGNLKSLEVLRSASFKDETFEYLGEIFPQGANIILKTVHHQGGSSSCSKEDITVRDLMKRIEQSKPEITPAGPAPIDPQPQPEIHPSTANKTTGEKKDGCCVIL